jgi:hypothetical protein
MTVAWTTRGNCALGMGFALKINSMLQDTINLTFVAVTVTPKTNYIRAFSSTG